MLLTKKDLDKYLKSRSIVISDSFAKELIKKYGNPTTDGDGHVLEYSEQDISEQIRKKIQKNLEEGQKNS